MLKYAIYISIALAIALPHENTLSERIGLVTFGLIGGETFLQSGPRIHKATAPEAAMLHKARRG